MEILQFNGVGFIIVKILALIMVLLSVPSQAFSEEKKVIVYFINGMLNSRPEAIKYQSRLTYLFTSEVKNRGLDYPASVQFDLSYNKKLNLYSTLIEAGAQHDFDANQWEEFIDKFIVTKQIDSYFDDKGLDSSIVTQRLKSKLLDFIIDVTVSGVYRQEQKSNLNLKNFVVEYIKKLEQGYKILLVAHSQGNFFANDAYEAIVKDYPGYSDSIKIISIGTPDSYVAGGGEYFSLNGDIISNFVPEALPGYMDNDEEGANGHGWIDGYMGGKNTRNEIFRAIYDSIESFYESDEILIDNPPQFNNATIPSRVKAGAKIFFSGSVSDDKQLSSIQMKVKRITTQTIDIETLTGTVKNLNGYFFGGDTLTNTGN